jgi:hypothetical protein
MRFELTRPHVMTIDGVSRLVEAGSIIDAAEVQNFAATPAMRALDGDALVALVLECQRIRRAARGQLDVPGFGHSAGWSRPED